MVVAAIAFGLDVAEWAIVVAAVIFSLDVLGVSRSARTIRRQNADFRERNATLEGELKTRDERISALETKIAALEAQVSELSGRDQAAVLAAVAAHEVEADRRSRAVLEVLTEIRDAVRRPE